MNPIDIELEKDPVKVFRDLYKKEKDVRLAKRYQAMYLLCEVIPVDEVAKIVGVHQDTLLNWIDKFNEKGLEGLIPEKQTGRPTLLEPDEEAELKENVLTPPEKLGYKFANWDGPAVKHHVQKKFNKKIGQTTTYRLLHKLDLRLVKPRPKLANADPKKKKRS